MNLIEEENILAFKEFNIEKGKDLYNLRIEISNKHIYINLIKINIRLYYIYRNKVELSTLIDKLQLEQKNKLDIDLLLRIFDNIYEEKKIIITIDDNNSIKIILEKSNNIKFEIKLKKENMTIDDKLNMIYNEIRLRNNKNYNYKIENNIKFEYLNNKINKKDRILNEKEEININESNKFIIKNIENNKDIEKIYYKIEEIIIEQKKIYETMIKEIKNIIEENNNVKIHINEEKEYIKDINSKIKNNPTPFVDDKEIIIKKNNNSFAIKDSTYTELRYKVDEDISNFIKIF